MSSTTCTVGMHANLATAFSRRHGHGRLYCGTRGVSGAYHTDTHSVGQMLLFSSACSDPRALKFSELVASRITITTRDPGLCDPGYTLYKAKV